MTFSVKNARFAAVLRNYAFEIIDGKAMKTSTLAARLEAAGGVFQILKANGWSVMCEQLAERLALFRVQVEGHEALERLVARSTRTAAPVELMS